MRTEAVSDSLAFRVLGPLEVLRAGEPVSLGGRKRRALLAFLLLHANETLTRGRLIDAIWGEEPPATVANALQGHVHALRKALGRERVVTDGSGYRLRVQEGELDLQRSEELVSQGRDALARGEAETASRMLGEALALWRPPALAEQAEEPFAVAEIGQLEETRVATLELRIEADFELGRHSGLVGELESLVAEHPFREHLRVQLMLALYREGRQADALEAYADARRLLVEELGIEPGPALRDLEAAILRQEPGLTPFRASPAIARGYVPRPVNPLVGRRIELAAVTGLLRRSDVRLLTVTGTGGTGKTRLALAAAEELALELHEGVYFVDLAPLTAAHLVATRVADALGVAEAGPRPLVDTLKHVLRRRTLLLVLDNFEHLLEAAPLVGELLAAAPGLTALVTSRAPLRVSGEHEYSLAPLGVPSSAEAASPEALALNDAAALFTARAVAVRPEFAITPANAVEIAGICSELDGLPLALELAAARMKLLSPETLLERLRSRRDTLGSGARDLPARQHTLRSTIDWSYELLGSGEQELFARSAVFVGGFTVEAAEAVCGAGLDLVGSLVDQSLVRRLADEEPRFAMLETVREYARERLVSSGEAEAVRSRHAEYFLTLAERLESTIREPSTLAAIQREHDNLRVALAFFNESSAFESELRLCGAIGRFWYVRGYLSEGRAHIEHALER
ncbi:MAG: BTAD domain-containing putative transcriptional regulator, partial [Gaiellaceae bacterium]